MLKIKGIIILLAVLSICPDLIAQGTWNPFEIKNRTAHWLDSVRNESRTGNLSDTISADKVAEINDSIAIGPVHTNLSEQLNDQEPANGNPFEISRIDIEEYSWEPLQSLPVSEREDADLLFVFMIILVLSLGVLIAFYRNLVQQLFKSIRSWNFARLLFRNANTATYYQLGVFNIFFMLSTGIFLYLSLKFLNLDHWEQGFLLMLLCIGGVGVLFIIKYLVLGFLGWVFELEKDFEHYRFVILIYNVIVGLVLLPFSVLIAFGPDEYVQYFVFAGFAIFLLILLWRQLGMLISSLGKVLPFVFHFFLYLCAVEIAPALLLIYFVRMI